MLRYLKTGFVLLLALWALVSLTANLTALPGTYFLVHSITALSLLKPVEEAPLFATANPLIIWFFIALLMVGKATVFALCSYGTVKMLQAAKADSATFQQAKRWGVLGGGFALGWFFCSFVLVGEHIFFMFLDEVGRAAAEAAFRYAGVIGLMTIFVAQPE